MNYREDRTKNQRPLFYRPAHIGEHQFLHDRRHQALHLEDADEYHS